jgi:hypothetical protein
MNKIETLFRYQFQILTNFIQTRRDLWPHWIMIPVVIAAGLIVAGLYLTATHPAHAEILHNQLITIFLTIVTVTAGVLAFAILRGLAVSVPEFTPTVGPEEGPATRLLSIIGVRLHFDTSAALPETIWLAPAFGPDILVASYPGETDEQYAERLAVARKQTTPARWVVSLKQGQPGATIYTGPGEDDIVFTRDDAPFQTENWTDEQRIVAKNARFTTEDITEFQAYIDRFAPHFREWSARKKLSINPARASVTFAEMVGASLVVFLLFSVSAFGQKSAKVAATKIGNEVPPSGVSVSYIFSQSDIYRKGNGSDNYAELLKKVPGYRDSGGGELLAVMAGNKSVYKASQTGEVADRPVTKAAAMRPHNETAAAEDLQGESFQMPDSLAMVDMAERAKFEIWKYSNTAGGMAKPWWDVIMFGFWELASMIVLILMICWLWAKVAAKEGFWEIHRIAKKTLVVVSLGSATILLINIYLWAKVAGWPIGMLFGLACVEAGAAYMILIWFNPDFRPQKGNTPVRTQYAHNNNNPELPHG